MANQLLIMNKVEQIINTVPGLDLLVESDKGYAHQDMLKQIENDIKNVCSNSSSTGVQTETHLYDKLIDSNHYWNEWDLRKQTIKMVNIRGYQTVSVQTVTSIFKVDNGTQIYEKVE